MQDSHSCPHRSAIPQSTRSFLSESRVGYVQSHRLRTGKTRRGGGELGEGWERGRGERNTVLRLRNTYTVCWCAGEELAFGSVRLMA